MDTNPICLCENSTINMTFGLHCQILIDGAFTIGDDIIGPTVNPTIIIASCNLKKNQRHLMHVNSESYYHKPQISHMCQWVDVTRESQFKSYGMFESQWKNRNR